MIALDFETFYDPDQGYTLKKVPTWQYLRDGRFRVLGCAVQMGGGPVDFYEGPGPVFNRSPEPGTVAMAHNATFDAGVAWQAYGWAPAYWLDTMLMSRYCIAQGVLPADLTTGLAALAAHFGLAKGDTDEALATGGEALAEYARNDVRIMVAVAKRLLPQIPRVELDLMDLHVRMSAYPAFELDTGILNDLAQKEQIPDHIAKACRSRDTLVRMLEQRGVRVEYKTTPTGNRSPAFAKTDSFMQRLLEHQDPVVKRLAEIRLQVASNIKRTRSQRMLDIGSPLPAPQLYYGAHTGRSSGLDQLNMQNLPSKGDAGRIRNALRPPAGYKLIIVDSGQIEVRVLAWLAACRKMLEVIRANDAGQGPDVYQSYGADVMYPHLSPEEVTGDYRTRSKPPMLAGGFGQGWRGLIGYAAGMGVELSETEAQNAVNGYRQNYPEVVAYWRAVMDEIRRYGAQTLPSGRRIEYPELRYDGRELVYDKHQIFSKRKYRETAKVWHGLATENGVQATARDVVMWQALQISQHYQILLLAHDEAVFIAPESEAETARQWAEDVFSWQPEWAQGLPLIGEAVVSDYYCKP